MAPGSNHNEVLLGHVINHREDFSNIIFRASVILMALSLISVATKLYWSWKARSRFEWHDKYMMGAIFCAVMMSTGCAVMSTRGLGQHDYRSIFARDAGYQKAILVINAFYLTCNLFVKLSLLHMYRKWTAERWGLYSIYALTYISFIFWLGSMLTLVLVCVPIRALWDPTVQGLCVNIVDFYYANAAIMIAIDIAMYVLPILFTRKSQLPRLSRGRLAGMRALFVLGFFVVFSSCVRLYIIHSTAIVGDMSYNYGRSLFASLIENHLAIIIGCAPSIKLSALSMILALRKWRSELVQKRQVHRKRSTVRPRANSHVAAPQSVEWFDGWNIDMAMALQDLPMELPYARLSAAQEPIQSPKEGTTYVNIPARTMSVIPTHSEPISCRLSLRDFPRSRTSSYVEPIELVPESLQYQSNPDATTRALSSAGPVYPPATSTQIYVTITIDRNERPREDGEFEEGEDGHEFETGVDGRTRKGQAKITSMAEALHVKHEIDGGSEDGGHEQEAGKFSSERKS